MDGFYNIQKPTYNYSDYSSDEEQKKEPVQTQQQQYQFSQAAPEQFTNYNEQAFEIKRNENYLEIEEGAMEIQKIQNQILDDYDYLYEEKANLQNDDLVKDVDRQDFMQLVKPEIEQFTEYEIQKSNEIIEEATDQQNNNFILRVLKSALKQEEVELIAKEQVTQNEDRSLAQLLNGEYTQKQMIEIKFPDTKEQNFKKLKSDKTEKDTFIKDFQIKIANGYNAVHKDKIKPEQVCVYKIEEGSIKVHFLIKDQSGNPQTVTEDEISATAIKAGYQNYQLKLHPFLKYCTLSPQQFDPAGNIDFTVHKARVEKRGGLVYNQPDQWKRYGLKVTGQYKNSKGQIDDSWLHDWTNGWAVAYHGFSETRGTNRDQQQKKVNYGINDIITNGFMIGSAQAYKGAPDIKTKKPITEGVYFSNRIQDPEQYYCSEIHIPEDPKFKYKIAFTCRINPKAIQFANEYYYVVKDKKDIRPYGILLRKYPK